MTTITLTPEEILELKKAVNFFYEMENDYRWETVRSLVNKLRPEIATIVIVTK